MLSRKRRRIDPPAIHPNNRYSEKPPDFRLLASLYPSFHPYVFTSDRGRSSIDFTDYNATRELTRVLLHHDHGVEWWIPDGQLCPTVPNRLNYIHWIGDLLTSESIAKKDGHDGKVRGFDIGTGANCIYPILGASLFGWTFVGSDVTKVALEWARKNVESNPHLLQLIEIRDVTERKKCTDMNSNSEALKEEDVEQIDANTEDENMHLLQEKSYYDGPSILVGVVQDCEEFDFCMCNPPFFERMEEASLNPKTSCGGTYEEMVCTGGEQAFITRIIEDSIKLKCTFRWFTSMVGRKANLKVLVAKLHDVGVSIVKTTEFVQGKTTRWGLAWSFMPLKEKPMPSHIFRGHHSFLLEGLQRQHGAFQVLKAAKSFLLNSGSTCNLDLSTFSINVKVPATALGSLVDANLPKISAKNQTNNGMCGMEHVNEICFRISIFEQIPGTFLVKGSMQQKESLFSGIFLTLMQNMEGFLKEQFLKKSDGCFKK